MAAALDVSRGARAVVEGHLGVGHDDLEGEFISIEFPRVVTVTSPHRRGNRLGGHVVRDARGNFNRFQIHLGSRLKSVALFTKRSTLSAPTGLTELALARGPTRGGT